MSLKPARVVSDVVAARVVQAYQSSPALPKEIQFTDSLKLRIDWYKETDFKEIVALVLGTAKEKKGVGDDEFPSESSLREKVNCPREVIYVARNASDNELVSVFFLSPCALSRSEHSPNVGAYAFVNTKHRGQRVGENLIFLMKFVASSLGHRAVVGRHALTTRAIIPGRASGGTYHGVIPKSVRIGNSLVVDDLIVSYAFHWPKVSQDDPWTKVIDSVPPLRVDNSFLSKLYSPVPKAVSTDLLTSASPEFTLRKLSGSECTVVENVIRDAASRGFMIGLDEFFDNGVWNRKFLRETSVLGVNSEELLGVVLFGPSAICRTESVVMGAYVLLKAKSAYQAIATALVDKLTRIAKILNYEGLILDVYRTEMEFVALMLDMGFKIVGSLPDCGYVKGRGYTDSLLLYKEFVIGSSKL